MSRLFAVTAPGLEPYTQQELRQLGLSDFNTAEVPRTGLPEGKSTIEESGGIEFEGDLPALYRANLHLRTASRVLVRLGEFHAAAFSELRRKARLLPWESYLKPGQPVAVRVTCHHSRLYHSDAVRRETATAISDRLGQPSPLLKFDENSQSPDGVGAALPQLVVLRLLDDECTLSIDSSGSLLHRRGYRLASAKAPLRETLAAGLILASGWEPATPLLDPFCGSGTIPIEAALLRLGLPPGRNRRFAFMDWPGYDASCWQSLLAESQPPPGALTPEGGFGPIAASDRDAGAIAMAQANAERAGVAGCIEFSCRAVSAIQPTGTGWVVTNPPYGLRVRSNKDLRNLYAQLGKVLRLHCPGWQVAILCSELPLLHATGLRLDTSLSLVNGGIAVKVARGIVPG